jgi:hypothetical protein
MFMVNTSILYQKFYKFVAIKYWSGLLLGLLLPFEI